MENGFIVTDDMRIPAQLDGSGSKFKIRVDGTYYFVKDTGYNKALFMRTLRPYSEYTASNFILFSGLLECQKVYLGKYQDRDVAICQDVFESGIYKPYKDLKQSSAGTDLDSKVYSYDDVLYVLEKKTQKENLNYDEAVQNFWTMFVFDAIIGNSDRHAGNWGFLKVGGNTRISPIIDNDMSLAPYVDIFESINKDKFYKYTVTKLRSNFIVARNHATDSLSSDFSNIIKHSNNVLNSVLNNIRQLDYLELIRKSTVGLPETVSIWHSILLELRFRYLILMEDFEIIWNDIIKRQKVYV